MIQKLVLDEFDLKEIFEYWSWDNNPKCEAFTVQLLSKNGFTNIQIHRLLNLSNQQIEDFKKVKLND